jgi:hypothetical protein
VRYLIKRLRRVMPNARFLAGFWMLLGNDAKAEEWRAAVGADLAATSLTHALKICVNEALAHAGPPKTSSHGPYAATEDIAREPEPKRNQDTKIAF